MGGLRKKPKIDESIYRNNLKRFGIGLLLNDLVIKLKNA